MYRFWVAEIAGSIEMAEGNSVPKGIIVETRKGHSGGPPSAPFAVQTPRSHAPGAPLVWGSRGTARRCPAGNFEPLSCGTRAFEGAKA